MTPTPAGTDAADLAELRLDFAARVAAHRQALADVKTEVMSQEELAGWWGISKNYVRGYIERLNGAEKVGRSGWRVPVLKMPASYLTATGLLHLAERRDAA